MTRCAACYRPLCGCPAPAYAGVVSELAHAKATFQQRAIIAAMGFGSTSIQSHHGEEQ